MSARARLPRKSAASTVTYADPHTSCSDSDGDEGAAGGGAAKRAGPSTRAKGEARAVGSDDADGADEDEAPRKKARTGKKGRRKGRKKGEGKLEVLKTLPVELLIEIFSYLDPNDLLALSMVNKQYRALRTAKSSARLWKNARERLKLPTLMSGNYKEWQYASLIFGTRCQICNSAKGVRIQDGLRTRLCNRCQTAELVKPTDIQRTHPQHAAKLHPRSYEVVFKSPEYALLSDLYQATAVLRDLEDQDEDSDIAEGRLGRKPASSASPFASSSSSARRPRTFSSKRWTSTQSKDSEDSEDVASPFSGRIEEYVAERKQFIHTLDEDVKKIRDAVSTAKKHLQLAKQAATHGSQFLVPGSRSHVLKQKVLALGLGYNNGERRQRLRRRRAEFSTRTAAPTADVAETAEWEALKPKILKLLEREKAKYDDHMRMYARDGRQRALRPRYDALKASLPNSARPFLPLFVDFLLFPSVKPLWESTSGTNTWADQLDDITEELEQFRLDLVVHARELILAATTDPDKRGASDEDEAGALGASDDNLDAFFARATSFVCCDAKDCRSRQPLGKWCDIDGRWRRAAAPPDPRQGAVGPLGEVLAHLHAQHNDANDILERRRARGEPQFHIALPLEVACAVGALLEVNELDAATAGVAELDRAERAVRCYEWENRKSSHRRFAASDGRRAWFDLLLCIKTEGAKLARMKPPLVLDAPVVALHRRKYPRTGGASGDGEGEEGA
ncbi:hypothetical protein JCM3770_002902 [Rhodotorula araucariae]